MILTLRSPLILVFCGLMLISCAPQPTPEPPAETTPPPTPATPETVIPETATPQGQVLPITATATIDSLGKTFGLEVTQTPQQRQLGLMFRENLPDNRGMLFEFDPARPVSFWMKNCLINLDIIFLQDGEIKTIARNVPPCDQHPCPTYGTPHNVDQVIEIRGGLSDEIGLAEGDKITVTFMDS